jgi:hypothetical protein
MLIANLKVLIAQQLGREVFYLLEDKEPPPLSF